MRQNRMSGIRLLDGSLLPWRKIKEGRIKIKGTMNFGHGTPPVDDEHWWRYRERRPDETMSGGEKNWRVGDIITRDSTQINISPREYYKIMELGKDDSGPFIKIRQVEKNGDTMEFRVYRSSQNYTRPPGGKGGTPNTRIIERTLFPDFLDDWEKVEVPASTGSTGGKRRKKTLKKKRRKKKTRGRKKKKGSRKKRKKRKKRTRSVRH